MPVLEGSKLLGWGVADPLKQTVNNYSHCPCGVKKPVTVLEELP
jgi:hypothetical protein